MHQQSILGVCDDGQDRHTYSKKEREREIRPIERDIHHVRVIKQARNIYVHKNLIRRSKHKTNNGLAKDPAIRRRALVH